MIDDMDSLVFEEDKSVWTRERARENTKWSSSILKENNNNKLDFGRELTALRTV
jgi:hypothetical protein